MFVMMGDHKISHMELNCALMIIDDFIINALIIWIHFKFKHFNEEFLSFVIEQDCSKQHTVDDLIYSGDQ